MMSKIESNGNRYCYFFYPELENFVGEEEMKEVKKELLQKDQNIFENYDEKRKEGENDSYICSLMRQDLVEEFDSYVNKHSYSLSSEICPSIFETNSFLIDNNNITLIKYAGFFGSIKIVQYLFSKTVKITPSLWLYSIHSKNIELIHLLESARSKEEEENEEIYKNLDIIQYIELMNSKETIDSFQYLTESIKCHHNDIADYAKNNLVNNSEGKKEIILNCMKYHNYKYFKIDTLTDYEFFYLNFYNYNEIVNLQMKKNEKENELKMIQLAIYFIKK